MSGAASFEYLMGLHTAPLLAGPKPASLVSFRKSKFEDFDALMAQFETIVGDLMTKDQTYYAPRITQIIEKYLGKGKKMSGVTRDQAELVYLVVSEIEDELVNGGKK